MLFLALIVAQALAIALVLGRQLQHHSSTTDAAA